MTKEQIDIALNKQKTADDYQWFAEDCHKNMTKEQINIAFNEQNFLNNKNYKMKTMITQNVLFALIMLLTIGFITATSQRDIVVDNYKSLAEENKVLQAGLSAGGTYVNYDLIEKLRKCNETNDLN